MVGLCKKIQNLGKLDVKSIFNLDQFSYEYRYKVQLIPIPKATTIPTYVESHTKTQTYTYLDIEASICHLKLTLTRKTHLKIANHKTPK